MTDANLREVMLPDGPVTISSVPLPWWSLQNGTGYVDPNSIAPDPRNVRKRMNPLKKTELMESIRANGVRQSLIVTPRDRAPWASVAAEHENCFLLAVGGHRRRLCSLEALIGAVPIHVKIYPSEKEHRMDMSVLNKGNEDLTDLEKGYEIAELQELGWKIDDLCESFGCAAPQLYDRMYLTKLAPSLKELLDPELQQRKRLGTTVGGAIGGIKGVEQEELEETYIIFKDVVKLAPADMVVPLDDLESLDPQGRLFALQRLLYAVIKVRNLSSPQAVDLVRERKLQLNSSNTSSGRPTERYQPRRRKDTLENLIGGVEGSLCMGWKPDEWRKVFELASREEVEGYMRKLRDASDKLLGIGAILNGISSTKKTLSPEVRKLLQQGIERRKATA